MLQEEQTISLKSIEIENDFSSTSHTIDTMACETTKEKSNVTIPDSYNKNYLRLLPVNTSTYYIYWEISDSLLHNHNLNLQKESLLFIVEDLKQNSLYQFTSNFGLGEFFMNHLFEDNDIYIKMGFIRDNKFIELLRSNVIHTFSTQLHYPALHNEVWIKKEKGWTEIIRSTMQHFTLGVSSAKYVEETQRLKQFSKIDEERLSSSIFHKENTNG